METTKIASLDRVNELKAFDETKTGVKGLVDAGISQIPRIFHHSSVACFFTTGVMPNPRLYGHIRELVSEENPPKYRETTVDELATHVNTKGLDGTSALLHLKI